MTDKEKIRAEIERQYEAFKAEYARTKGAYVAGRMDALDYIEQFIDSLPEETSCPKESDDLDKLMKEVQKYYSDNFYYITSDQPTLSILTNIARYFTKWQKRKMMEGAVDGSVKWAYNDELVSIHYDDPVGATMCYFAKRNGLNVGDKVKIIILPNE